MSASSFVGLGEHEGRRERSRADSRAWLLIDWLVSDLQQVQGCCGGLQRVNGGGRGLMRSGSFRASAESEARPRLP